MLRIIHRTTKPCLKCGVKEKTAICKGDDFMGPLCMEHALEFVPAEPVKKLKPKEPAKS